jgi:hypothetical protein
MNITKKHGYHYVRVIVPDWSFAIVDGFASALVTFLVPKEVMAKDIVGAFNDFETRKYIKSRQRRACDSLEHEDICEFIAKRFNGRYEHEELPAVKFEDVD